MHSGLIFLIGNLLKSLNTNYLLYIIIYYKHKYNGKNIIVDVNLS